jgi:Ca-activated chloride channel family protein
MTELFAASSGLAGVLDDVQQFFVELRFARPPALWLLVLVPTLVLVNRWATRRRRAAVAQIGRPAAVAGQLTHPIPRRKWLGLAYPLGLLLLILGIAGPLWGKSEETGVAVGRDVLIVIDLSNSMLADDVTVPSGGWRVPRKEEEAHWEAEVRRAQKLGDAARQAFAEVKLQEVRAARRAPVRWRAAREGALDLLDGVAARGGHRVGVVVFAARSKVICPLTTDYDYAREVISQIDMDLAPPEIRPDPDAPVRSGTRIGEALIAAVAAHDARFPGYQEIFLISDGDDPAAEDREWVRGADEARKNGIPVYTVGIGNPDEPRFMLLSDEQLATKLQEEPLTRIARDTRGQYIPARTNSPQLGEFFRTHVEPLPSREVTDESLPLPKERYVWVIAPALALFAVGWLRGR